ncbi:hypothetical protein BKA82DRAFT_4011369 [Pisolithus tinctorius]|nr:hypothetical protein BKA82DRAFT_4011369 [Pisolithus tinctorius]
MASLESPGMVLQKKQTADGPQIPTVSWSTGTIWQLVSEIEKPANLKVLFGIKENSNDRKTGDYKVGVYQAIAQAFIPEVANVFWHTAGDHIKKIKWLKDCYVKLAAKLKQTGGEVKDGEDPDTEENPDVFMDFYIPAKGPDENTPELACNVFGVSHSGHRVTWMQPVLDENIDPILLVQSQPVAAGSENSSGPDAVHTTTTPTPLHNFLQPTDMQRRWHHIAHLE